MLSSHDDSDAAVSEPLRSMERKTSPGPGSAIKSFQSSKPILADFRAEKSDSVADMMDVHKKLSVSIIAPFLLTLTHNKK